MSSEVTNCSKHGGASLNILSGFVAGNMSAFWMGLVILGADVRQLSLRYLSRFTRRCPVA